MVVKQFTENIKVSSIPSFNPLVQSFDELSDKEVEEKILSLNKKYWQTQNPQVREQITALTCIKLRWKGAEPNQNKSQMMVIILDNLINIVKIHLCL